MFGLSKAIFTGKALSLICMFGIAAGEPLFALKEMYIHGLQVAWFCFCAVGLLGWDVHEQAPGSPSCTSTKALVTAAGLSSKV